MAEPIARAIVRDVDLVLQEFGIRLERLDEATQQRIQDRLLHVVDVHIKRAVLRVLEEPIDEISLPVLGGPPVLVRQPKSR